MMMVNVLSRKFVKPCRPTPPNLSTYKISLMDEINRPMHVSRILYYHPSDDDGLQGENACLLEESLARVLPLFYPLAGRYNKEKHQVDCNDEGALYSIAQVDCQLHKLIESPEVEADEQLDSLLAVDIVDADEPMDPMLAVQINRFQCGGLAVGVCASHRIFDSGSLGIFLTAWANTATNGGLAIFPDFSSPLHFPAENLPPPLQVWRPRDKSIIAKRCVFSKNAISRLRQTLSSKWKSISGSERPPSRVVAVSTVLTQAILRADRAKHGKSRNSLIAQTINVRERTIPPVPEHSCGSWVALTHVELNENQSQAMEHDFLGLALKMRAATVQGVKDCTRILSDKAYGRWAMAYRFSETAKLADRPDYKVIRVTDWSKFGEYDVNFGFGKPVWVSLSNVPIKDLLILVNTRDNDGIEAWVFLHESDMPFFVQDDELVMLTTMSSG